MNKAMENENLSNNNEKSVFEENLSKFVSKKYFDSFSFIVQFQFGFAIYFYFII